MVASTRLCKDLISYHALIRFTAQMPPLELTYARLGHAVGGAVVANPAQRRARVATRGALVPPQLGAAQGGQIQEADGHVRGAACKKLLPGARIAEAVHDAAGVWVPGSEEDVAPICAEVPVGNLQAAVTRR